jgi:transposase, IS5 family
VVSANVEYPTDSGLLAQAVKKIGRLVRRIKAAGEATRTRYRDRSRSAGSRVRAIGAKLKLRGAAAREQAQATVMRITGELADLAERSGRDAYAVLANARRAVPRVAGRAKGRLRRAIDELATTVERSRRIIGQTRRRFAGVKPDSATRLVSLHDPDARPIATGRINRPVEFGYKAQVIDNQDGIVVDYTVEEGNPADAPQLAPAIQRIAERLGTAPRAVAADRGYGEARVDEALHALGVKTVAIPRKGQPGAARRTVEQSRGFRDLVKWRTGSEGRISHLKHRYGWARSGVAGRDRTAAWCGHGVLAHNLVKITTLVAG